MTFTEPFVLKKIIKLSSGMAFGNGVVKMTSRNHVRYTQCPRFSLQFRGHGAEGVRRKRRGFSARLAKFGTYFPSKTTVPYVHFIPHYIQLTMLSTFKKYLVFLDVLKCLIYVKSRGSKKTLCKYLFVQINKKY